MKKVISLSALFAIVAFGVVTGPEEASAADLGTIDIDCDAGDIASAAIVATEGIGDTFRIQNTGSTDACQITATSKLSGEDADHNAGGSGFIIPSGTSGVITVVSSGKFTITSSGIGNPSRTFFIDACTLDGSGTSTDPWLVEDLADLTIVGDEEFDTTGSCSLDGYYLQTADISRVDLDVGGTRVDDGAFVGTYDGDHYSISYTSLDYEDRDPLFDQLGSGGTIKKLRLTGTIKSDGTEASSLVRFLVGGTISEVESTVQIEVYDSDAFVGGLVAVAGDNDDDVYDGSAGSIVNQSSRIQYSSYVGSIDWDNDDSSEGPAIGGLVGSVRGTGTTEVRDSYARAAISYDSSKLEEVNAESAVYAGGLVGSDGLSYLGDGSGDPLVGDSRSSVQSTVRLIRSFAAGSFSNTCAGTPTQCNTDSPTHVFTGGLVGFSYFANASSSNDLFVSAFWLSSSATNPVGKQAAGTGTPTQPLDYTDTDPGLPTAPGLSATLLKTITTYQSEEGESGLPAGASSGAGSLEVADSTGSLAEQDYRFAIESGNVQTFVASDYDTESNFLTRNLYADTDETTKSYRREGEGDLTAHGGDDPETVLNYPTLGRVWEICANANNGYPVLVWEEESCAVPSGGSSSRDDGEENPYGMSAEEYAEFLASGLTYEQFVAARLAATGTPSALLPVGFGAGLLLVLLGLTALVARRRLL